MNIRIKIFAVIFAALLSSCYGDKGNYDYVDVNKMTISFPGDTYDEDGEVELQVLNVVPGITGEDKLDIKPTITPSVGTFNESDYTYKWILAPLEGDDAVEISNELNLSYQVEYANVAVGTYELLLYVTDKNTTLTQSRYMSINVNSVYGKGLFVLTDNAGNSKLDMIADISGVEYIYEDILAGQELPNMEGPVAVFAMSSDSPVTNKYVQVATENGTYRFDPVGLKLMPELTVSGLMSAEGFYDKCVITQTYSAFGGNCMNVIDGNIYNMDRYSNYFGRPFNVYEDTPEKAVKIGLPIGLNMKEHYELSYGGIRKAVVYDTEAKRFTRILDTYYSTFSSTIYLEPLVDKSNDANIFQWDAGLDFVTSFHSFYGEYGEISTILTDGASNFYAYRYTAPIYWREETNFIKSGKYDISSATDIANAKYFFASATQRYIFYTAGSKVYGIALEGHNNSFVMDLGAEITAVYDAPYYEEEAGKNIVYIATYGGSAGSATIHKFEIEDNPNVVNMTYVKDGSGNDMKWEGFEKIVSMFHRI